jgi:hypothetical protein
LGEELFQPQSAPQITEFDGSVSSVATLHPPENRCNVIGSKTFTFSRGWAKIAYKATTEGRKFGLRLIQGTQNKAQYDARYGQDAATMLSCPRYTIMLRCKEPESAKWLSSLIGDEEKEMPRTGVTASVSDWGLDSMNYSTQTERRPVISKEEISALPDLAGYWKYGDAVVPFRFDFIHWKRVAEGFVPRQTAPNPTPRKSTKIATNDDAVPPKPDDQKNVWELLRSEN